MITAQEAYQESIRNVERDPKIKALIDLLWTKIEEATKQGKFRAAFGLKRIARVDVQGDVTEEFQVPGFDYPMTLSQVEKVLLPIVIVFRAHGYYCTYREREFVVSWSEPK